MSGCPGLKNCGYWYMAVGEITSRCHYNDPWAAPCEYEDEDDPVYDSEEEDNPEYIPD